MHHGSLTAAAPASTEDLARRIRRRALEMVTHARASHIGSAISIADIVAVLYGRTLRVDPAAPRHPERDRFILSKGHACVAVYAALAETGFIDPALLQSYGADGSTLMAHISHKVPGAEFRLARSATACRSGPARRSPRSDEGRIGERSS